MNDGIMYVWQVVGDYDNTVLFTCARMETAKYLRDWCQAVEMDNWRDSAIKCNIPYKPMSGHEQLFEIQESEVIL